ncbi:insulinase family protein [Pyxidicoccus sp. 3LG]
MSVSTPHVSRLPRATARLLGWVLLPWLAMQGCANAPPAPGHRHMPTRAFAPSPARPTKASHEVFPSGLRLVVREDLNAPNMTVVVSYRVGATDEPEGKEGLATLSASLTRLARPGGVGKETFEELLEASGVTSHHVSTHDSTELGGTLGTEQYSELVALEAQRMSEPLANITEEDFRRVRAQQTDTVWVGNETQDRKPSLRWLQEKLLVGHAYGRPSAGTPESLQRLTLDDVRSFVKANYTPAHAVVVVSGPLPLEEAKLEAEKAFADLTGVGAAARTPPVTRIPPPAPPDTPEGLPMVVARGFEKAPQLHFLLTVPGRYSGKYVEGQVAMRAMTRWLQTSFEQRPTALRQPFTFSTLYQELDGLTVIDCHVRLKPGTLEEEARKLAAAALEELESVADKVAEETLKEGSGAGPSEGFQRGHGITPNYHPRPRSYLRHELNADLHQQARRLPAAEVARLVRATGRVDFLRMREEQLARSLDYDVVSPYLSQHLRPERVRTLLVLP